MFKFMCVAVFRFYPYYLEKSSKELFSCRRIFFEKDYFICLLAVVVSISNVQ